MTQTSPRMARIVAVLVLLLAQLAAFQSSALAFTPTVDGEAECLDDGSWQVTWNVSGRFFSVLSAWDLPSHPDFTPTGPVAADVVKTGVLVYPAEASEATETFRYQRFWTNGQTKGGRSTVTVQKPASGCPVGDEGSVGDRVWFDSDGDGTQDPGEPGIPGVTVELTDCNGNVLASDVTDAGGNYLFDGLTSGTFCVDVDEDTLPDDIAQTFEKDGTFDGFVTQPIGPGDTILDVDFGYQPLGALGDTVFLDEDQDGTQDAGEPGIGGVTVELTDCDGNVLDSTTTAADGTYLFDGLPADCYQVVVTAPDGLVFTLQDVGDDTLDSDVDPATGTTGDILLGAGETDLTNDAGLIPAPTSTIGDRLWFDTDGDGTQDPGEPGIPGVTVELTDCNGNVLASDVTDAGGNYLFDGLPADTYCVDVDEDTLPDDIAQTFEKDGTFDGFVTQPIGPGDTILDVDFGYQPLTSTIGDRLWFDTDGDGTQDPGEPGIPGVTVELTDCNGNVLASDVTDAGGNYLFDGLTADTYCVDVDEDTLPDDIAQTFEKDGTFDGFVTQPIGPGDTILDVDFGYQPLTSTIGDRLWFDTDGDGTQDPGEPGIPGVTVELTDCNGNVLASDVTDAGGNYLFDGLTADTYCVDVDEDTLPDDIAQTFEKDGTFDGFVTQPIGPGDTILDVDFGYQPLGALGDTVFLDEDQDGTQDAGEPGIGGVTVELTDCDGNVLDSTTTAADGTYLFDGLPADCYQVVVTAPDGLVFTLQDVGDDTLDSDVDPATGTTGDILLGAGETDLTNDAGLIPAPTSTIGDRLWFDTDGDGTQDPGEPGIPGVTVELTDCNGNVLASDVTDAGGNYLFDGLPADTYCVDVDEDTLPDDIAQTFEKDGTFDGFVTQPIGPGDTILDVDFGYQPLGALGDTVFLDEDQDGTQDAGEPGIGGVTVELTDCDGNVLDSTTTAADGTYLFDGLPADCYQVVVTAPDGLVFTLQDVGDDTLDSDVDPATGTTGDILLGAGETDLTNDAGLIPAPVAEVAIDKTTFIPVTTAGADVCDAKPVRLVLEYVGDTTAVFSDQDSDKAFAIGSVGGLPATVSFLDGDGVVSGDATFDAIGDRVVLLGKDGTDKFSSATQIAVGGQTVEFHTSCSQPLFLGNQFGSVRLVGFTNEDGGTGELAPAGPELGIDGATGTFGQEVTWNYVITNPGDLALDNVVVTDDAGTPGDTSDDFTADFVEGDTDGDGLLDTDESWLFSATGTVQTGEYVNVAVVTADGVDANGTVVSPGVSDEDDSSYTGGFPPGDVCDTLGKPLAITFLYTGANTVVSGQDSDKLVLSPPTIDAPTTARILVSDDEDPTKDGADVYFDGTVDLGEEFIASAANAGTDKFSSSTFIHILDPATGQLLQTVEFHVSCSQPIALGDQYGNVQIVAYVGEDGSSTPTDPTAPQPGVDICDTLGKPLAITFLYTGANTVVSGQDSDKLVLSPPTIDAPTTARILVSDDEDPTKDGADVYFDGTVDLGEEFIASAANAGTDKFSSSTFIHILDPATGQLLQTVEFHTSCSQPIALDDQYGNVQIVAYVGEDGSSTPTDPTAPQPGVDICDTLGKPLAITFLYTGANTVVSGQDSDKLVLSPPTIDAPTTARILVSDDEDPTKDGADVYFDGTVDLGEEFIASAANAGTDKFSSSTFIHILDPATGQLLQTIEFHTSCSQPIALDDQYGNVQIVGYLGEDGSA